MGISLSHARYEEIKKIVVDMFVKYDVSCVPVNGFELATKMGIKVIPYSAIPESKRWLLLKKSEDIKKYVNEIIKASNEDFLKLEVNMSEFYLSEMINRITAFYEDKLRLLKTDFEVQKYLNCLIKGDLDRGVEVMQNIMENAVKYGDGKSILISFEREEDCVVVSISNSGCTLPENELPHIFDCFLRGSNVGSVDGSGLGLYICRQLMKKMDGDIFADCQNGTMTVSTVFRMM